MTYLFKGHLCRMKDLKRSNMENSSFYWEFLYRNMASIAVAFYFTLFFSFVVWLEIQLQFFSGLFGLEGFL